MFYSQAIYQLAKNTGIAEENGNQVLQMIADGLSEYIAEADTTQAIEKFIATIKAATDYTTFEFGLLLTKLCTLCFEAFEPYADGRIVFAAFGSQMLLTEEQENVYNELFKEIN